MGILKGSLTARRYTVEDSECKPNALEQAFTENRFVEPTGKFTESTVGWVRLDNPLNTDFVNRNEWLHGNLVVAGLREDTRKVPGNLLKAHLAKRCQAWCEANGRTRAPATIRNELKETLYNELLAASLPRMKVTEFAWDTITGVVIFTNTSEGANDQFRKLFRKTFGLELTPYYPDPTSEEDGGIDPDSESEGFCEQPDVFIEKFLTWVMFKIDDVNGTFRTDTGDVWDAWIDGKIRLDGPEASVVVTDDRASDSLEAMAALYRGKRVTSLKLGVRHNESGRSYTVTLAGENLDIKSAKMPATAAGENDAQALERMWLYGELFFFLNDVLVAKYVEEQATDAVAAQMRTWFVDAVEVGM